MEGAQVVQKDDGTLTAKQEGDIPAPVKESVLTTVTAAVERLLSVAEALRSAPTTDAQVDQPLPDNLAGTVADVARELAGVGERYPSPASKAVAKADPIPEPVKAAVVTQLKQAADRLAAVLAAVTGAPSTTEQMDAPLPATITDEVIGIAHALAGVCEKYPSPVAAATEQTPDGQGTTKAEAEAEPAPAEPVTVADATTVVPVADAAPAEPAVPAEPTAAPAAAQAPATGPTAEDVAKAMSEQVAARLATQFERLSAIVKGVQERVEKVERAEGLPNSQPAQGSEQPTNKNGQDETFWPADLNDARLARPNPEKAPSGSPSPTL